MILLCMIVRVFSSASSAFISVRKMLPERNALKHAGNSVVGRTTSWSQNEWQRFQFNLFRSIKYWKAGLSCTDEARKRQNKRIRSSIGPVTNPSETGTQIKFCQRVESFLSSFSFTYSSLFPISLLFCSAIRDLASVCYRYCTGSYSGTRELFKCGGHSIVGQGTYKMDETPFS
jgi:hypothetical protein